MIRCMLLFTVLTFVAGCSREPAAVDGAVTEAAFNTAGAPTVEFNVPDMMCPESCAVTVKEILSAQPGVKEVRVDFDTKSATVAVDESQFKTDAALAALVDRFFVHSEVKSPAAAATATTAEPASPSDAPPAG